MPDAWEEANGLDKNNAADAKTYTLDSEKNFYTNIEVYVNGIVEEITKAQNADALTSVEEYYPTQTFLAGIRDAQSDMSIRRIEYYSLDGKRLAEPQTGICIRRIFYAGGQVETDKVMK